MNAVSSHIRPVATENGWSFDNRGRERFEKDGYEIYFQDEDGFELTIRDPETMERKVVYEHRGPDVHSPYYIACIDYILKNAESVVSCLEKQ